MSGLGLRGQILSALFTALLVSFSMLSVAVVQLTGRARTLEQEQTARSIVRSMETAAAAGSVAFEAFSTDLVAHGDAAGVELISEGRPPRTWGVVGRGVYAEGRLGPGETLRVWLDASQHAAQTSLSNLLLFYVAITGAAILLLAYVVLTTLIVRPVEALTLASERLSAGNLGVQVPVKGAGEIARLAVSFNGMASQLRDDREALERRLRELEQTTQELEATQDQLVRSAQLASVGRLSAGLAHEIGNPLAAVLGLVELLQDQDLESAKRSEFLERVHRETHRIHNILKDLLAFSRGEVQSEVDDPAACAALDRVLDEAIELVQPQKDLQRVTISKQFEIAPAWVPGSPDRWTQLAVNLLINAADAIEGDGTIRLRLTGTESSVTLEVIDSGRGFPEDLLPQAFEPFVTNKAPGKGTGLGLAICRTLVERTGGSIRAHNNPDRGATVAVTIPRHPGPKRPRVSP